MKYIRTADGVFEVKATPETNKMYENSVCYQIYDHNICEARDVLIKDIIKEADTIKELCDEFVVEYEDGNHLAYSELEWAKDKALRSNKKYIIYGAIWTSKGLIYVAKMNDKGVLELI